MKYLTEGPVVGIVSLFVNPKITLAELSDTHKKRNTISHSTSLLFSSESCIYCKY